LSIASSCLLAWAGWEWTYFVLSGFLITGILLDTREANNYFGGFYARRVLRIFPLYYLVLTTIIIAGRLLNSPEVTAGLPLPHDRWVYFCYLTNWIGLWKGPFGANYIGHFWSLAVEEQFYLVWPLVIWLARPRAVPWVAGALAVLAAITRLAWVAHSGSQVAISLATVSRLDDLSIGAFCAYLFRDPERMVRVRRWLPWVASLGLGSFVLAFSGMVFFPERAGLLTYGSSPVVHTLDDGTELFAECGGYTLLALGFGALVLLAAHTDAASTWMQKFLKSRLLTPIGIYSYGIYVFHVPIIGAAAIFVFPKLIRASHTYEEGFVTTLAYIVMHAAVTFVVSAISYEFFEKRILRFKRYFEPEYAPAADDAIVDDHAVAQETVGSYE